MKRLFIVSILLALCAAMHCEAGTVTLSLAPNGGLITGLAGATIGWDFTLANDTSNWISATNSALTFETNPLLGSYTDFIGPQGGPLPSFAVAPFSSWSQTLDLSNQLGLGSYTIDASAPIAAEDDGIVLVNFDIFNGDPTGTGQQTGNSSVSAPFSVIVTSAPTVPEPSTLLLLGSGLVGFAGVIRPKRIS